MINNCPVCDSTKVKVYTTYESYVFKKQWAYVHCRSCGIRSTLLLGIENAIKDWNGLQSKGKRSKS